MTGVDCPHRVASGPLAEMALLPDRQYRVPQVNEPADGTGTILGRLGDDCAVDTVSDEYA
jgi:hypothetical protein